jgi:hypothetical protein
MGPRWQPNRKAKSDTWQQGPAGVAVANPESKVMASKRSDLAICSAAWAPIGLVVLYQQSGLISRPGPPINVRAYMCHNQGQSQQNDQR